MSHQGQDNFLGFSKIYHDIYMYLDLIVDGLLMYRPKLIHKVMGGGGFFKFQYNACELMYKLRYMNMNASSFVNW